MDLLFNMFIVLAPIGFCFFMMIYTGVRNARRDAGKNADMYLPKELRRHQNGQYWHEQMRHQNEQLHQAQVKQDNDLFMQEQIRQQNEQFMNDSMKFGMDSVTPFEHGGLNVDCGNSFNSFGAGGFFDGGFGGFGF